ncbi:MAG TPA: ROK family protein [Thermoleophilaceae bacterium]
MSSEPLVLGVDVGGTKVAAGAVRGAEAHDVVEHPTDVSSTEALLDGIAACVKETVERAGEPAGVGVGMPSQIEFSTGTVETSVNIPLTGIRLREELGRRFGAPVFVDNDANCAALAESSLVGSSELVMLTLGTGVGGGVVIGGKIFRGANGLGAELGHFSINPDGPPCPGNCPNYGCLEAYCSGQALERDATELAQDRPDSRMHAALDENGRVSGHEVVKAADEGDPDALRIFDRFGRMLGIGIAGFVNVFEPELFVIGGGLSGAAHLFLEHAEQEAGWRALPALWERVTIGLARGGPEAGLIGAGVLAAQELAAGNRDTEAETESTTEGAR